jgi:acetylornithine deacetylase/succinyl-diaminopimelate desuccinylase-like protein
VTMKMAAVEFARENKGRFVEELKALLRIPSISTDPERVGDVRRAAEFVAAELKRIGMENVRLIETTTAKRKGHPLVYADWLHGEREGYGALLWALRCAASGAAG